MTGTGQLSFESALGTCALAWRGNAITRVSLPGAVPAASLDTGADAAPPSAIARVRDRLVQALDGKRVDLSRVRLDLDESTPFQRDVYTAARAVRRGRTATYGEIARTIGRPRAMRAVGQALGANPVPLLVPCHRVLAGQGGRGGFSADGGLTTKAWLLHQEGVDASAIHGFGYDLFAAANELRVLDPRLAPVIDLAGFPRMQLQHTASVFRALARAIVYQQLSGKAAATIFGRVCDLLPRGAVDLNATSILAQPEAALRGAGLSNNKMLALRDLATRELAGEIPDLRRLRRMDDDAVVASLTRVRGIGRWTVEMMLMFRLGRPDVMAVDDLGLRQGHAIIMGRSGETPATKLARYAERWRPYRSVASWYLWRAVELKRAGRLRAARVSRRPGVR